MHPSGNRDYSTLEVNGSRLPEFRNYADEPPEAISSDWNTLAAPLTSETSKQATICGLRERVFWIVFAVVITLVVVVGAVVGGIVGGLQASKTTSSPLGTPTPSSNSSLPLANNSAPAPTVLVSKSKLASLNCTDLNDVAHYRVYFQVSTKAIYQSAWNSSVQTWAVSPVTTSDKFVDSNTNLDIKEQTPIAADVHWHSASVSITKPASNSIKADSFDSRSTSTFTFSIHKIAYKSSLARPLMGPGAVEL